jgi:uncharacterized SAM-binding protein YcdF (DUF218 family)
MIKELIIVLGGMIVRTDTGVWRSSNIYDEGDRFGIADDELRFEAAAHLSTAHNGEYDYYFLMSGGKGQLAEVSDAPSVAEVGRRILLSRGIPNEKIVLEETSGSTLSQLYEVAKICSMSNYDSVRIVTNEFHVPRVETMMRHDKILQNVSKKGMVQITSAEEILLAHAPEKWKSRIEYARTHPLMSKRLMSEERGIKDFLEGKYRSNYI